MVGLAIIFSVAFCLQSSALPPIKVETKELSLSIPSDWKVSKVNGGIFAFGKGNWNGWPTPMLIVEYCTDSQIVKVGSEVRCDSPCNEKTLRDILFKNKPWPANPKITEIRSGEIVEYIAERLTDKETELVKLSCGKSGRAYVRVAASGTPNPQLFDVLNSLQWK